MPAAQPRPGAGYLWAMLLARIYESQAQGGPAWRAEDASLPALLPPLWEPMRLIAFVTEAGSMQPILKHHGEPTTPPRIAPSPRGPPLTEADL